MADLCLCEYTDHGHCGVVTPAGVVDNDPTLDRYAAVAIAQAQAGAHVIAPSGMMDGQVAAIRAGAGQRRVHRDADPGLRRQVRLGLLRPVPRGGRGRAAVRRPLDLPDGPAQRRRGAARGRAGPRRGRGRGHGQAGAALPGHRRQVADAVDVPVSAYQVSGEYAMVEAAAAQRLDRPAAGHPGDAHRDPPGRCRLGADVLGGRGGPLAAVRPDRWRLRRAGRLVAAVLAGRRLRSCCCSVLDLALPGGDVPAAASGWSRSSPSSGSSAAASLSARRVWTVRVDDDGRRRPVVAGSGSPLADVDGAHLRAVRDGEAGSTPARPCSAAAGRCRRGAPGCRCS